MHTCGGWGDSPPEAPRGKSWGGAARLPWGVDTRYRTEVERIARGDVGGSLRKRRLATSWGAGVQTGFQRSEASFTHETHRRCAHIVLEPTGDVMRLGDPVERLLARTGGSNGGWDGCKLQMTQYARDHRFLGDGSNDPE